MKQVEHLLYVRAVALRRFCKQSGSRSAGSRESCLVMAHSVCLWGYEISDHTQVEIVPYARSAALKFFANKIDPDQAALLRAAWSWSTLFI